MNIGSGIKKSGGQITKQAVKQIAQEPFEVLKTVAKQVSGSETSASASPPPPNKPQASVSEIEVKNLNEKDKTQSRVMYESLQKEIQAIYVQKKEKERQTKELAELQKASAQQEGKPLVEPVTRRSRNPLKGMAKKISDMGKRAEIRMPPSG